MAKVKTAFYCQNCGHEAPKWMGKCPSCDQWNTLIEERVEPASSKVPNWKTNTSVASRSKATPIQQITYREESRILSPDQEFNRVLGGGIVPGSLTLIGGEPGIGKSTLMLQLALEFKNLRVLYVSGEESEQQLKMRAERIRPESAAHCYVLTETSSKQVFGQVEEIQPQLLIIDSIQTLYSSALEAAPGSISQVRECTAELLRFAKDTGTPVFIIGHITKDGAIAGPKVLEHMVDTVLQFEGDRHHLYRILRAIKNRFGPSSELGIYQMRGAGLREVTNPSEILLSQREEDLSGIAIAAMIEGIRPMLIEVQALVGTSAYGTPQRTATGFDSKRMSMLLAVLEKKFGFRLSSLDVFLNIAGGIRVEDPAIDLAVLMAIISSQQELPISTQICFAGEVGLSGEIRAINRAEQRINEAQKLGFSKIFIPKANLKGLNLDGFRLEIQACAKVEEVFSAIFG